MRVYVRARVRACVRACVRAWFRIVLTPFSLSRDTILLIRALLLLSSSFHIPVSVAGDITASPVGNTTH